MTKLTLQLSPRLGLSQALLAMLVACGGDSGSSPSPSPSPPPPPPVTYTVGGTVTGLIGSDLVLQNNGGNDLAVVASGAIIFRGLADGAAYAVTVKVQPAAPAENCVVTNGSGSIDAANVTNVTVVCATASSGHFAYVANAGDDTISVYSIDSIGALASVGNPVPTGTSPYAITGSPDRHHVYVVNQNSNDISVYAVNSTTGALTEIVGSPFATGADPQALAFDPSGAYLYVADHDSSGLSAYVVDVGSGSLTPLSPAIFATGASPSAVVVDPSGKFVYVANNGGTKDISAFAIATGTGALTPVAGSPFRAGDSPHGLAISNSALYTANDGGVSPTISVFGVNSSTGALTASAGSPFNVTVEHYLGVYSGYGDSLFITSLDSVGGYFMNAVPTEVPGYRAAAGANAFSVTIYQSYLYVCNDGAANISAFRIDDVGGSLSAVPGSPFAAGTNPDFIAIL